MNRSADFAVLAIADLSRLSRAGLKGQNAAAWLTQHRIHVPAYPNSWESLPSGGVVARLGESEFFLEDEPAGDTAAGVPTLLGTGIRGVFPVIREDTAILIAGARANDVLLETCSVDFSAMELERKSLALTSMVGVGVLVIPYRLGAVPAFRIWADPSFGPYLWQTLLDIVVEHGGAAVACEECFAR